jgi:hypothetical protein
MVNFVIVCDLTQFYGEIILIFCYAFCFSSLSSLKFFLAPFDWIFVEF